MHNKHFYKIGLEWTGNSIINSRNKLSYERIYELFFDNKPNLTGSADATFHGNPNLYNPEEMLLSALSSCYMMSFFYLCGLKNVKIKSYKDEPLGIVKVNSNGSGQFEEVTLQPVIVTEYKDKAQLLELFSKAKDYCFIARSCNFKIHHNPRIDL